MDQPATATPALGSAETVRRIDANWNRWLESLAGVPDACLSEPGVYAGWSVKDLIGNVAYWDADALDDLEPGDPRTRLICREITEDTWQHDEHMADVCAWRTREGI